MAQPDNTIPDHGALVGWEARPLGETLMLTLQTRSSGSDDSEAAHSQALLLTQQQAVQLAHNLFRATGETPPQKPSPLRRLFGG
ncbi:hypothetical protein [Paraurantiacibacter namhicola]|uniref:Uncharacterized protein n=1 Tax=Paraurantiacibacter namhicola TaxID=645517 RepID=A0A1C7D756_9SPHN|nr:hypothetical protein [Paraurantiacibacter namhicola]ANU07314.1 hypothetical protein A6F65_01004 [Paraurantiacibacter namhicola]